MQQDNVLSTPNSAPIMKNLETARVSEQHRLLLDDVSFDESRDCFHHQTTPHENPRAPDKLTDSPGQNSGRRTTDTPQPTRDWFVDLVPKGVGGGGVGQSPRSGGIIGAAPTENHPQYTRLGSNPNLSIIVSLVYCESDTLDHATTEAVLKMMPVVH
uniref:Uncharacterized protein n=1 Tax=Timema tahoe TaxID=61484 RepID=A0A7R9FJ40_9NEOP|nr:unnamed protein product [Timema tahoe]